MIMGMFNNTGSTHTFNWWLRKFEFIITVF